MAPYEVLYGKRCRCPVGWFESSEARLLGTHLVKDAFEKVKLIQDGQCAAQSIQKSYADRKARNVAFMVGERVLLQVSPMKGVMMLVQNGKLSPGYIRPFEVLERVREVAYRLALPPSLTAFHLVFHVSMLQKYHGDPSHVFDFSLVQLDKDLSYVEELVTILDIHARKLRSKSIASVNVLWRGHPVEEATRVTEHDMCRSYSHLFTTSGISLLIQGRTFI
ncbi:uncharacterized protein [Nicotiana tomentosiformis]|uniref:uncharacterized protein n=1 Tax=Nicotiana tomentosiformis TaxID=4098 RepID=UPI00388C75ED